MLNRIFLTLFALTAVFSATVLSQPNAAGQVRLSSVKTMPIGDVREGMKGTAKTVFQGNKSEEFGVEILGVLPNWVGPRQDIIVGKLSGANAERTFVFAGMSGSPVYIDGKLVGAISYSFPFAKEPICGITPVDQMTSVMEQETAVKQGPNVLRAFSYSELRADRWQPTIGRLGTGAIASGFPSGSRLEAVAGQTMRPIATPLYFSGISQEVLNSIAPQLTDAGIVPIAAASGGNAPSRLIPFSETTLLGGDSVMVFLARGDIQIGSAGTVTLRDGEKIYAFGHPFFGLGSANLPMTESHVVTVIPNSNNSFKLAVADGMVGAMTQDRATAIYGKLGEAPKLLPVRIKLVNSRGKTGEINFESAFDEMLTPLIVSAGVANTLTAQERGVGDMTVEMTGQISVKGEEPIRINRRFAGGQAVGLASAAAAVPLANLLKASFDGMEITGIDLTMTSRDGSRTGTIDRITVDRTEARPGETVEVTIHERSESGVFSTRRVPVKIPNDAAAGAVTITVGDGNAVQQNTAVTQFTPRSAAELISTINRLKRPDRLYAVLSRTSAGTIIGASELPNLPPSVLATLNNDRSAGGSKPSVHSILAEIELPVGDFIISGSQTINIEVIR